MPLEWFPNIPELKGDNLFEDVAVSPVGELSLSQVDPGNNYKLIICTVGALSSLHYRTTKRTPQLLNM